MHDCFVWLGLDAQNEALEHQITLEQEQTELAKVVAKNKLALDALQSEADVAMDKRKRQVLARKKKTLHDFRKEETSVQEFLSSLSGPSSVLAQAKQQEASHSGLEFDDQYSSVNQKLNDLFRWSWVHKFL